MRLLFVYWKVENAGSAQDIYNYCEAAKRMEAIGTRCARRQSSIDE